MRFRMRYLTPATVVVVALGAGSALLATNAGGGATDDKPSLVTVSDCKPAPARCGSEDNDLVIAAAAEAARRMHEMETTGTTTVTNPEP